MLRLLEHEQKVIKESVLSLDPLAEVYVFGSRANPDKRGGDIDLLILSQSLQETDKRKIRWAICDQIGEQKIDLVIAKDQTSPFVRIALSEGVKL
ncbi:MAG: nucleotidyltransferase domain-containing protein [Myxococcaceae bacterium]